MAARRLERRPVERVWGRQRLPDGFADCAGGGAPIGEIWFEGDASDALLVKYLFTADRLSIQVHPDDRLARAAGHRHGKDEAWLVLDAEPGAVIGLGLNRPVSKAELRAAALDGSIEGMLEWHPVRAGDFFYIPANTVHAIGGGCSIIEIQQNSDITYRLYDYGRPRELHLDEAIAVAKGEPHDAACRRHVPAGNVSLVEGPYFRLDQVEGLPSTEQAARYRGCLLVIPRTGQACVENEPVLPGQCALAHALDDVVFDPAGSCLIAQPCARAN